jgi:4-hydroxybenzoate polyprenyltransferase
MPGYWPLALLAALAFNFMSSAVYIYNDWSDREEDKRHPEKSRRPLASGEVTIPFALTMLSLCLLLSLLLACAISWTLVIIFFTYLLINVFYNHWFRRLVFIDVLCISSGFLLRILSGTIGIGLSITWWLTMTATLLSLFIALCKRRLELNLSAPCMRRKVLSKYNAYTLDYLITIIGSCCFTTYVFYIIFVHHDSLSFWITLPFCGAGLWRFASLAINFKSSDDPVIVFWGDTISRWNLVCFFSLTMMALR